MAQTGKRVKPSDKKKWLLLPIGLLAAAAIGFGGICAAAAGSDVIYPNTYMGDQDVGGMTRSEAAAALTPTLDAMEQSSGVRAMLDGEELDFFSFQDLGVQFDADESAASAFDAGRSGGLLSDGWNYLRARMGSKTHLIPQADSDWRSLAVDRIAQDCASEPTAPSYQLTDAGLLLTKGADGRQIDRAALRDSLETAESDETGAVNVELPCTAVPAEQIDLGAVHEELASEMVNAGFDKATGTITPEHAGASFDVDEAQRMLTAAQPGETVTVPATVTLPEVTAEQLKSVLFRDVLGTYTTHVSGTSGRLSNVRLAAKRCNGAIMNSGETFNYNAIMAPYNGANGYYLAPGYVGGKTVDSYGGGVCYSDLNDPWYYSPLYCGARRIGWDIPDAKGSMFVWAPIPAHYQSSMAFCMDLLERAGVLCTPGASFGPHGEGYVRFALVLPPEKIAQALAAIENSGILKEA